MTLFRSFNSSTEGPHPLTVEAFYIRFSGFKPHYFFPQSLSLLYFPLIDQHPNLSRIRPHSTSFLTLHKTTDNYEAIYGSSDRVRASPGVCFEVHFRGQRLLYGILTQDNECMLDSSCDAVFCGDVATAEVYVALKDDVALIMRLEMACKGNNGKNKRRGFDRLQMIPEEGDYDDEANVQDSRDFRDDGSEGGDLEEKTCMSNCSRIEMDLEGVRWAIDVGLWVMCLGVGLLVSGVSSKSFRRRSKILD